MTTTLVDEWLAEQRRLTPVERFSARHDAAEPAQARYYRDLIPSTVPGAGQQYRFEVDLDACTGCKSCVVACHSLNGLDEDESWRSVGLLHGTEPGVRYQQTVTTGCHHCVDPACLDGCPVDAYEKDPVTGIVTHLDDQCIGCSYCTLTCPYEVPRYNPSRGIVRKCDMCQGRLAAGEAPACVQACPNGAIAIGIVDTVVLRAEAATGGALVPGAPASSITIPSTEYRTARGRVDDVLAADRFAVRPAHAHDPLTVMLVLTQLSVGAFLVDLVRPGATGRWSAALALVTGLLALAASVLHLGRPRLAWRAVLGLRHSWLSREALAFGAFAGLAVPYAGLAWIDPASPFLTVLGSLVAATGLTGVTCSVLLYARTRRTWWRTSATSIRFGLTTLTCGLGAVLCTTGDRRLGALLAGAAALKLAWEASVLRHLRAPADDDLHKTALLLTGALARPARWRAALGGAGGVALPAAVALGAPLALAFAALPLLVAGELLERRLFFTAVVAPRMPGVG
ncbi:MAG: molybdopterin oxidoreductase [Actinomycetia bacterium]|nr:molybdopterin oxidoreductase [Actinomycetes bacterium]